MLDEAIELDLLRMSKAGRGLGEVRFVHPMVRAAVYGQLRPARLVALHRAAADLVDDEDAALRHRAAAATHRRRRAELSAFGRDRAAGGGWAAAAWAFFEAARLSGIHDEREKLLPLMSFRGMPWANSASTTSGSPPARP